MDTERTETPGGTTDALHRLLAAAVKVDITPQDLTGLHPVGGGSFSTVHDPIFLRALLLAVADAELAIVALDLIEVGDMVPLRERIARELGIPADHVLLCASHSHGAPRLGEVSPGAIAHGLTPEGATYTAWVYERVISALSAARADLRPARIGFGTGRIDLNVNRDEYRDGSYVLGVDSAGPSDKTVSVIDVTGADGHPIAMLMSYAMHPAITLGTRQVSGDFAGAATRYAEQEIGDGLVALWAPGALGDQEPRLMAPRPPLHGPASADYDPGPAFALADAQGMLLAAEAMRVRAAITRYCDSPELRASESVVELPSKLRTGGSMPSIKQEQVASVQLRTSVALIGTIALAGAGGELVTNLGAKIRAASPLTQTVVLSLVNDRLGYFPDDASYPMDTFEVRGSPVAAGYAEQAIVGSIVDAIRTLTA